jgi:hypothetical protein
MTVEGRTGPGCSVLAMISVPYPCHSPQYTRTVSPFFDFTLTDLL